MYFTITLPSHLFPPADPKNWHYTSCVLTSHIVRKDCYLDTQLGGWGRRSPTR